MPLALSCNRKGYHLWRTGIRSDHWGKRQGELKGPGSETSKSGRAQKCFYPRLSGMCDSGGVFSLCFLLFPPFLLLTTHAHFNFRLAFHLQDVIRGNAGHDTIYGRSGKDLIYGGIGELDAAHTALC